jgi:hypothetical protein
VDGPQKFTDAELREFMGDAPPSKAAVEFEALAETTARMKTQATAPIEAMGSPLPDEWSEPERARRRD